VLRLYRRHRTSCAQKSERHRRCACPIYVEARSAAKLRRAKRRWKIERLFAWLHNCRRVVTRWERHVGNYLDMVQLACARILLRAFMR
jgi:transposase